MSTSVIEWQKFKFLEQRGFVLILQLSQIGQLLVCGCALSVAICIRFSLHGRASPILESQCTCCQTGGLNLGWSLSSFICPSDKLLAAYACAVNMDSSGFRCNSSAAGQTLLARGKDQERTKEKLQAFVRVWKGPLDTNEPLSNGRLHKNKTDELPSKHGWRLHPVCRKMVGAI